MLLIEANDVFFSYGDKQIYQDMNFRLMEGEHIALVGHNGAGKSTFLKLLLGQLLPDSGSIKKRHNLNIGVIEQHLHFEKEKSIYEVLQDAFADLFNAERKMNALAMKMQEQDADPEWINQYGELQEKLITNDFYTIDARIKEMADGLGLSAIGLEKKINQLSGGQLTKLCLAKLLLENPDILLLDEPTNYLDVGHIRWLTNYLNTYSHAFIVISHDTEFLDQIAQFVYHLENQRLIRYVGNYQMFVKQHEARLEQQEIAFRQQQREIKKLETYIQKNKVRASTAKQAKSREKQLDKIDRLDPPAQQRKPIFQFTVAGQPVRVVFSAENLYVGYDRPLFPPINLTVERGEKVALVGHNGIGKTTLIRTLLGERKPLSGSVVSGDRVLPGYFSQLSAPLHLTPIEWLKQHFPDLPEQVLRQHLAQCGVYAEHMRQPMDTLSGGEETKVRIGRLMLQKSNVLIFDEPTNHLDVDAKAALSKALNDYEGTVVVVSHEPSFYEQWITKTLNVEAWAKSSKR
ncbi:ABC-F family ATP-binding cassette domain-containing protein [Sporolactobacillus terrae]|uniref:ABC transporter ATP-binding protein n=1 Tax=Sporolactobacillus terrae TaxID=269673 RepID=A0A410D8U1_9BACL|nr:ABC-F family ATP-binding cassette domain-containing protein [Sporolactobacillus terrae]QAA22496.1 heme ABC transporter ATP-binding protein [Sporolactobacillus terrae]QAA25470.1 heme ABC transporter ATP-binding protein [Sporolactobacillus terrae]UAK17280.1 ATP-binding cassette domain-containing protein [Sporolactobacillus terrae]BBN98805.1 ABC transporter ATP-binding protein [Sporolactobacillus terrae]